MNGNKTLTLKEIFDRHKKEIRDLLKKYKPYFNEEKYIKLYEEVVFFKDDRSVEYISIFDDDCVNCIKKFLKEILCIEEKI